MCCSFVIRVPIAHGNFCQKKKCLPGSELPNLKDEGYCIFGFSFSLSKIGMCPSSYLYFDLKGFLTYKEESQITDISSEKNCNWNEGT